MNQLSVSVMPENKTTMTSREISELVGSRHDHVKTSVDRLAASGLISSPPLRDSYKDSTGRVATQYLVGKRDSYVIVAQLSPSFTAALVDRWQALEAQQAQALPQTYHAALLSLTEEVGKRSGKAHPAFTTMVTGKGQVWLERKYRNINNG
jgi:phage regulator Rha-like protein